ncbi:hypothetical protein P692DRAFT_2039833 [Suillus brevipes Sb2]|nr:hypothetical protein P692DRAFT_2039833 [Suillus brevipes Sb2]
MISTELSPLNTIIDVRRHTLARSEYYGRSESSKVSLQSGVVLQVIVRKNSRYLPTFRILSLASEGDAMRKPGL